MASIAPRPPSVVAEPADAHEDDLRAARDRRGDELAGAVRRRGDRVALVLGDEREAGRLGDLDDRGAAVLEQDVAGLDLAARAGRSR